MPFPFQKHMWIALGGMLVLFLGMAAVVYHSTTEFMQTASLVARSHQIRSTFERIGTLLNDIDRSHHAYVISGEVFLLEPYSTAVSRITDNIKQARGLIKDKPGAQERLDRLDTLVASRLRAAEKALELRQLQDVTAARALIQSDQRREESQQIQQIIKESLDDVERELAAHSQRHTALAESTMMVVGGGSLVVLAFALGAGLTYRLSYMKQHQAEIALQASEAKRRLILAALPIVTYTARPSQNFGSRWVSDNIEAVSGFTSRALLDDTDLWASRLHPADRERVRLAFQQLPETSTLTTEYRWQVADGTYLWFLDRAMLLKDSDGASKEIIGIWLDISAQKSIEDSLRQVNDRLIALVQASPIGIVILDAAGNCQLWNPAAERIFGWREDEVLGRPLPTVSQEKMDEHRLLREGVMKGTACTELEVVQTRKDGTNIDINLSLAALRDPNGTICGVIGLMADVSQRKRIEAQLMQSYDRLRALSKRVESVREEESARIAREIHDELGQALTGVKLNLAWVAKRVAGSQDQKTVDDVSARLLDLMQTVETTIQSVRKIATALRPPILDELGLGSAIDWLTRDFEKRTGIRCHCSMPTEPIPIGPEQSTRLFRIVQEALTNVARHAQATSVHVRLMVSASDVQVEIRDNGRGITERELTNNRSMGLMGMRERAEMGNGGLSIYGTPGRGTTVTIQIPLGGGGA